MTLLQLKVNRVMCLACVSLITKHFVGLKFICQSYSRFSSEFKSFCSSCESISFFISLYCIRQTPGYLQKQPCHLPKETGVQLLCAASYDIWCRDMDTDQTSTEQTCGRTDKNGKKYAQHHIQRQKDQHLGQGEVKSHRYNQHCKKNEMVLGRAYQPPQRRPMDLACHQLETI